MLVEILIVVAIMAMISGLVAVAAIKYWQEARIRAAGTGARSLRHSVEGYWAMHGDEGCPTFDELVKAGAVDEAAEKKDPWGGSWRIQCDGPRVTVSSDGPDRRSGTADDIRVPPKAT
jgi:type II secretory pathway pseudopilin PulG